MCTMDLTLHPQRKQQRHSKLLLSWWHLLHPVTVTAAVLDFGNRLYQKCINGYKTSAYHTFTCNKCLALTFNSISLLEQSRAPFHQLWLVFWCTSLTLKILCSGISVQIFSDSNAKINMTVKRVSLQFLFKEMYNLLPTLFCAFAVSISS